MAATRLTCRRFADLCRRHVHAGADFVLPGGGLGNVDGGKYHAGQCQYQIRRSPPGPRNLRQFEIAPEQHTTMPDGIADKEGESAEEPLKNRRPRHQ